MKQLYEYQIEGSNWLKHTRRGILGDEMGIGKTLQAIHAARDTGAVVVCLASSKITTWAREILGVDPQATILVVMSGDKTLEYSRGVGTHWVIVNFELLDKRLDDIQLNLHPEYKTVIVDESHKIKEPSTIRSKATVALCDSAENVYLLTGTALLNRPMELFNQLRAIRHPLGNNWYSYAKKYCGAYYRTSYRRIRDPKTQAMRVKEFRFLDTTGASNLEDLKDEISVSYLRRTKAALGDKLPPVVLEYVETTMDVSFRQMYEQAWDTYKANLEQRLREENLDFEEEVETLIRANKAKHLTEMGKLLQIASLSNVKRVVGDAENAVEQGEQVIIFTNYTKTLQEIKQALLKLKIPTVSISGEDNQSKRIEAMDKFQSGQAKVFVGNIVAAGTGIDLYRGSIVLFPDMDWTPGVLDQAISRAHRNGQQKQVNVYCYTAKDTAQEHVVAVIEDKRQIIKEVL